MLQGMHMTELNSSRFDWIPFYEEVATKLLAYRNKRKELLKGLYAAFQGTKYLESLHEKSDGSELEDICPFTFMAIFNRGLTEENNKNILINIARLLQIQTSVPQSFAGTPWVFKVNWWFFGAKEKQLPDDIDALWLVFERAIEYADSKNADERLRAAFVTAFDDAFKRLEVKWKLTMGLYWIRPRTFVTLDGNSRDYICDELGESIGRRKDKISGEEYLELLNRLNNRFSGTDYPVHSFPELSLAAKQYKEEKKLSDKGKKITKADDMNVNIIKKEDSVYSYSIESIIDEGCFLGEPKISNILSELRRKKNLILQGPPGTGKSWLARRLAYALIGKKDSAQVRAVQFHPNLSYEDFIRGWRPSGADGRLALVDGPFMEMINAAKAAQDKNFVLVIEEINRGNPAQIFGEMLTLLEADKRTAAEALELSYQREGEAPVYIPSNLYVIGTMNIADRSLAQMDLALRRRFAFVNLTPQLNDAWRRQLIEENRVPPDLVNAISDKLKEINQQISEDPSLGAQFQIGHSYVTPPQKEELSDPEAWFRAVVETEIGPLLDEYWLDEPDIAKRAKEALRSAVPAA